MDSSLKSTTDEFIHTQAAQPEEVAEEEHHIHLPNPSLWPLLTGAAILVIIVGLLFIPDNPWLVVIGAPLLLIGIMGWALEDPMAPIKAQYLTLAANDPYATSGFLIGQEVVDKNDEWVGTVQARFDRYILAERGMFSKPLYVPIALTEETIKENVIRLTVSEGELLARLSDGVPNDLYDDALDSGLPSIKGVPMFARRPLSPAETGHYNYGRNYPGINTDASGSYHRDEVVPRPQRYIGERRKLAASRQVAAQK